MRHAILAALAGMALLAGCGSNDKTAAGGTSKAAATSTSKIDIKNFLFSPDPSTVKVGDTVSVTNEDDAPHTLTDRGTPETFDSGTIKHGQTRMITFKKAGTYKYFCEFHATMHGTVTVTQ